MKILEGDHNPFDLPEGGQEEVFDESELENPFIMLDLQTLQY